MICDEEMLQYVYSMEYVCSDGMQWVCLCCHRQLKRRLIPVQAKANGLELTSIPPELSSL